MTFNPLTKYDSSQIVPTENDTYFRMQQIHGTVHDEGAITMKGISGNAGLFSNAEDLGQSMEYAIAEWEHTTPSIISSLETIQLFTSAQYPNNDQ